MDVEIDTQASPARTAGPWRMQLAFWTSSAIVLNTIRAVSGELRGVLDILVPTVVWIAVGYGVSSLLLVLGRRLRVVERRLYAIAIFAFAGVIAATLAAAASIVLIGSLLSGGAPARPRDVGGLLLILGTVFALWSMAALMVAQLHRAHDAERHTLVAQSIATEARLRMLRQQLNPHFLFNSLNSLAATIDEDRDRAQALVLDLSSLLRDALADDSDDDTLGAELDRVERYLRIERARFEGRMLLHASVAEPLRSAPCLPFLLQPLVENAIKHGATGSAAEVQLTATLEDGRIRIRISNAMSKSAAHGTGVGLANVRERLAARYGAEHRFEQRQRPDGWMDVELSWPCVTRP